MFAVGPMESSKEGIASLTRSHVGLLERRKTFSEKGYGVLKKLLSYQSYE